jgi:polyisoprenoid-binding protein YceI
MFTTISGKFSKFDATEAEDNNLENAKLIHRAIDSVTTGNADRDTFIIEC